MDEDRAAKEARSQRNPKLRRKRLGREARRRQIAMLIMSGVTNQERICSELGFARATVSKDIAAIEQQWREESVRAVGDARALDLARIDEMIRAVLPLAKGGNLQAVEKMTALLKRRADIYGYDAPKQVDARLTGRNGGAIQIQHTVRDMSVFTDEEVFALASVAERVKTQFGDGVVPALTSGDDDDDEDEDDDDA